MGLMQKSPTLASGSFFVIQPMKGTNGSVKLELPVLLVLSFLHIDPKLGTLVVLRRQGFLHDILDGTIGSIVELLFAYDLRYTYLDLAFP